MGTSLLCIMHNFLRGQAVGIKKYRDHIGWGPFVQVDQIFLDILPWGPDLLGTICPAGLVLWGSFVQGDRKSRDQMDLWQNAWQSSIMVQNYRFFSKKYFLNGNCIWPTLFVKIVFFCFNSKCGKMLLKLFSKGLYLRSSLTRPVDNTL